MTNTIAAVLLAIILALLAIDAVLYDWAFFISLARRFLDLVEYLSFWR